MGSFGFADLESERTAVRDNQGRQTAANYFRAMTTPTIAGNVTAVANMYPNLSPSTALSGVLAGLDPRADDWGDLDLEERKLREEEYKNYDMNPLSYLQDVVQGTYGIAVGTVRAGMIAFDTIWEEGISRPLRAGVLAYQDEGFGAGELSMGSIWQEASASSGFRAGAEFFGDPFGNIATIAADYGNLFLPFADPFEMSTESRVNLGSGFFANSDLVEADDSRVGQLVQQGWSREEAMSTLTNSLYGTPVTQLFREGADAVRVTGRNGGVTGVSPGRLLAMQIVEPGTTSFNLMSGAIDFGAQIYLDPNNALFMGARFANRASQGIADLSNSSGLINGIRKSVFLQDADKALNSGVGQGAMRFLADTDDIALIDSILSPATRSGASNSLLRQVQMANTPEEVTAVVKMAVGGEIIKKPWKYSTTSALTGGRRSGGTVRARVRGAGRRESGLTVINDRSVSNYAEINVRRNSLEGEIAGDARDFETVRIQRYADGIVTEKMPDYGGFQPRLRMRRMDSSILYDAATGRISRRSGGRNQRAISRLFSQMSGDRIDISNMSAGRRQVQTLARSLDLTPEETQKALARWVDLGDEDISGSLAVVEGMMGSYRKKLYAAGVSEEVANAATTVYRNQDEMRRYFVDRAGDPQDPGVLTMLLGNGESVPIPLAHSLAEISSTFISVPGDQRTIRRMTDFLKRSDGVLGSMNEGKAAGSLFYGKDFQSRVIVRAADGFMAAWKPMVLLRPAWTIRVIGEEQARLAAAGLHEFSNPMKSVAMTLANKNLSLGLTTRKQMLNTDLYGDALSISLEFQNAMSRRAGSWFDSPGGYGAQKWIKKEITDKDFDAWWFRELNQLQTDKVSSSIARSLVADGDARSLDSIKQSFFDGDLAPFREELMGGGKSPRHKALSERQGSDAYIESMYARINSKAGGRYETLRDDGWWYDDMGNRVREATNADAGVLRAARKWQPKGTAPSSKIDKGVRIQARTLDEYRSALSRSGMSDAEVNRKLNYLSAKGAGNDAGFVRLDPDARTVLIPEGLRGTDDILAEARTVQFRVTEAGNQSILNAIGTGRFSGVDFSGAINTKIQNQMSRALKKARESGGITAPQFVKGVDESDVAGGKKALDLMFDGFMGKQTNRYSRSPAFTRSYWNTILDLESRGLIDGKTMDVLKGMTKKSVWNTQRNRKALVWSEKMDDHVNKTEQFYGDLIDELDQLPDEVADAITPSMDRMKELLESDVYDVGRYNRIIADLTGDLKSVDEALAKSIKAAIKDESLSAEATGTVVKKLQARRDEIEGRIKSIEREFSQEAIDDLDEMYGMMDGMPEGYVGGIEPGPISDAPSDLEDAMRAEVRRQAEYGTDEIPSDLDAQVESLSEGLARDDVAVRAEIEADPQNLGSGQRELSAPAGESEFIYANKFTPEEHDDAVKLVAELKKGGKIPDARETRAGNFIVDTKAGKFRIIKVDDEVEGTKYFIVPPKEYAALNEKLKLGLPIGDDDAFVSMASAKRALDKNLNEVAGGKADSSLGQVLKSKDELKSASRTALDARDAAKLADASVTSRGTALGERVALGKGKYSFANKYGEDITVNKVGSKWEVTLPKEVTELSGVEKTASFKSLREATEYAQKSLDDVATSTGRLVDETGQAATEARSVAKKGVGRAPDEVPTTYAEIKPRRVSFSEYEYDNGDTINRLGKKWKVTAKSESAELNKEFKTLREAKEAYQRARISDLESSRVAMQKEQKRLTTLVGRRTEGAAATKLEAPVGKLEKAGTGRFTVRTERGVFRIEKSDGKWYVTEPETPKVEQLQVEGKAKANLEVEPEITAPSVAGERAADAGVAADIRFIDAKSQEGFASAKKAHASIKARINPDVAPEAALDPNTILRLKQEFNATDEEIASIMNRIDEGSANSRKLDEDRMVGQQLQAALPDTPNNLMSLAEVDNIAKAQALTTTQDLMYDLSKRSNFSDMTRLIFPFAEAWFEIISTWSRLIQAEPRTIRRFQQAYEGAKDDAQLPKGAFNVEGYDGAGFFFTDPTTKKEMFAIPYLSAMMQGNEIAGGVIGGISGAAMGATFGGGFGRGVAGAVAGGVAGAAAGVGIAKQELVPEGENIDLAFQVQGVNMAASSAIPGLGPLMQVPVSFVLSKSGNDAQALKDALLPFGEPNVESVGDIVDSFIPSYAKKFLQAAEVNLSPDMKRVRANTTMEVAGMMVRRGEGSFSSQTDIKETLEKASKKSTWLYMIRGLASFAGPTSPSFSFNTKDADGNWFFTGTMVREWQKTREQYGGDDVAAMDEFTGMYGINPQTFMTGKTYRVTDAPLTERSYAWKKEHEEMYQKFPGTASLLDPSDPLNDEFDYSAYVSSLREGTRRSFTPEQWAEKSNQLAANVIMERFRNSANAFLADSPKRSVDQVKVNDQLFQLQVQLQNEYPGYNRQIAGVANVMSTEQRIDEIRQWTTSMRESDMGKVIGIYMAARENAIGVSIRSGNSETWWKTSMDPAAVRIRDELIAIATMLRTENPGFSSAWASLFRNELRDHLDERAPQGGG